MQTIQGSVPSAIVDSRQSAAESKENIRNYYRGFPAIKVTQFTILPICVSVFCIESVLGLNSRDATYSWLDRTHSQAVCHNEPARILQAIKL